MVVNRNKFARKEDGQLRLGHICLEASEGWSSPGGHGLVGIQV